MTVEDRKILASLVKNMSKRERDPLRPLIDAYLMERDASPERAVVGPFNMKPRARPGGRLSPSSLCSCERQAAFKFLGVQGRKRVNPDLSLIFDDGDWRHHKWQSMFRDMELVLGPERFRVLSIEQSVQYEDLYIAGSLDALLWVRPNPRRRGFKLLVDIKGINKFGFQKVLLEGKPLEHHPKQVIAYCRARGIARGYILYDNKDDQRTWGCMVYYGDAVWAEVEAWSTSVLGHLRRRRLPPMHPECTRGTLHYERCPWKELCFGKMDKEEVTELAYRNFRSVDAAWRKGNRIVEGSDAEHPTP
jgi:hypothetical protein